MSHGRAAPVAERRLASAQSARALQFLQQRRAVVRVAPETELEPGAADDLGAGVPALDLECGVDVDEPPLWQGAEGHAAGTRSKRDGELLLRQAQRALGPDLLGDVPGGAANDWDLDAFGPQGVAVRQSASLSPTRQHLRLSARGAVTPQRGDVVVELVAGLVGQQVADRHPQDVLNRVAQRAREGGVARQDAALEIVRGEQVLAVLDEVSIAVLARAQLLLDLPAAENLRLQRRVLLGDEPLVPETGDERAFGSLVLVDDQQHLAEADAEGHDDVERHQRRHQRQ